MISLQLFARDPGRRAQTDGQRRRERAGPDAALLAAAVDDRLQPHARSPTDVDRT